MSLEAVLCSEVRLCYCEPLSAVKPLGVWDWGKRCLLDFPSHQQ